MLIYFIMWCIYSKSTAVRKLNLAWHEPMILTWKQIMYYYTGKKICLLIWIMVVFATIIHSFPLNYWVCLYAVVDTNTSEMWLPVRKHCASRHHLSKSLNLLFHHQRCALCKHLLQPFCSWVKKSSSKRTYFSDLQDSIFFILLCNSRWTALWWVLHAAKCFWWSS